MRGMRGNGYREDARHSCMEGTHSTQVSSPPCVKFFTLKKKFPAISLLVIRDTAVLEGCRAYA